MPGVIRAASSSRYSTSHSSIAAASSGGGVLALSAWRNAMAPARVPRGCPWIAPPEVTMMSFPKRLTRAWTIPGCAPQEKLGTTLGSSHHGPWSAYRRSRSSTSGSLM